MGFDDLTMFHSAQLERIIAGIRRLHGEANTRERCPITKDILLRILSLFNQSTRLETTLYASFCLAFAAFLRVGEFTYTARDREDDEFCHWFLTRRSVRLYNDHLELTLSASKTDPFRRGITLTVASAEDDAYPVKALKHLFQRWPAASDMPLFETAAGVLFTRDLVTSSLRQSLKSLHIEGHYSGHSFRRGAATSARLAGLSDEEIQLLGRWKSDSYRLYIVTHPSRILLASRRHQHLSSLQR